jgi:hypothetical protein
MATNHQTESTAMQIGEVAKRSSLTVDAIRFYEKRKLLPKADRSAGKIKIEPCLGDRFDKKALFRGRRIGKTELMPLSRARLACAPRGHTYLYYAAFATGVGTTPNCRSIPKVS